MSDAPVQPAVDQPTEEISLLDRYLTAFQHGDLKEQQRLLDLDPSLKRWDPWLKDLERLATAISPNDIPTAPSASGSSVDLLGHRFGKYEVVAELGRGGMGVVYRARQTDLDRHVALKLLTAGTFATEQQRRRFLSEARLAARVRHPNIVAIHEAGELYGQLYFTMELISGRDLDSRLNDGPWPVDSAVALMIAVARAVQHLHEQGILHRDLKPSNILLDDAGQPYLMDFGLARGLDELAELTVTGTVLGTPSYMPPEQAAGRVRDIDMRSDVYGLGAVFYELLCGRPPFAGETRVETLLMVLEREALPPRQWNPRIPREVQDICLRCLEKDPARRYPSAEALAQDLEAWSRGEPLARMSMGWQRRLSRLVRRYPAAGYRLLGIGATIAIILMRCFAAADYWDYYAPKLAGLAAWAGLSVLWEWSARGRTEQTWTSYAFTLTDVVVLTALLQAADASETPLVAGFPLLVSVAGLWLDAAVVRIAGAAAVLGYGMLLAMSRGPAHWHVATILVVVILCTTAITEFQVRRFSVGIRR